jgi:hypothetical protein
VCLKAFADAPCDLRQDGAVDVGSLAALATQLGSAGPAGDLNHDGTVNDQDITLWLQAFQALP